MGTSGGSSGGFANPMTTAGDLIDGGASGAAQRLAVGSTGEVLTVAAGAPSWAAASGGAVALIASTVLASPAANFTFSAIAGTYNHLQLILVAASSHASENDDVVLQFNGDTSAHYDLAEIYNNTATTVTAAVSAAETSLAIAAISGTSATANTPGVAQLLIPAYAGTTFDKTVILLAGWLDAATSTADTFAIIQSGMWRSTAAITSIKLFLASAANFIIGSAAYLYGIT